MKRSEKSTKRQLEDEPLEKPMEPKLKKSENANGEPEETKGETLEFEDEFEDVYGILEYKL